jgi:hypothetical protein
MKTPSELSRLYRNIDRKNLSPTAQETLKKIMKANGNWRKRDEKVQQVFLDFYEKLKEKKPVLIKTTPEYKAQLLEIKRANVRKAAETRAAKFQDSKEKEGAKGNQRDATRPAKRIGWRLKGKHNYKKPTIADIRAKRAYFENRVNRSDKKRKKFPMLEKGGYMAKGGILEQRALKLFNKLEEEGKLKRYVDTRGNGKKYFETIIPNSAENGYWKRYESTSRSNIGTLQNEYLDKNDVINHIKKTLPNLEEDDKMAKGGIVVTSIKDIPNFEERLNQGRITYRGLGVGKLSNDFYNIAGEGGKMIKVDGKEYYITDTEFNSFSRDADGMLRVKFAAPKRKFERGGYMARGGQVEFLHSDSNFDNKYYKRFNGAIGSFAWIYEKRYNEGILYPLDAFDLDYYAHLPLKENEVILRYQSDRMRDVDSSMYLIKFNVKKMLVYFMEDAYSDDDKNIKFSPKGLKLEYLTIEWQGLSSKQQMNIDLDKFDKGGNVEASYSVWVRKGASDDEEVVKSNLTKSQAKKLMDSLWDKDEYYEIGMSSSTYENGGALLDYDQLIGKNILIYSMGVKNPNSYKISSVTPPDPRFSIPTLILEVGGGAEYIEGREKISNFLKGNQIEMNDGGEYYAIELVSDSKSKEHYAKGGQTPFEKLSNKVADNYEGKKVPNKYQKLYGKTYDRSEAKEVGDKVAAKVYRLQQQKMARGGEILFTDKHRND